VERKWRERYSQKFRRRAVARMNACDNIVRLSRELAVSRSLLYKRRYRLEPPDSQVNGAFQKLCQPGLDNSVSARRASRVAT